MKLFSCLVSGGEDGRVLGARMHFRLRFSRLCQAQGTMAFRRVSGAMEGALSAGEVAKRDPQQEPLMWLESHAAQSLGVLGGTSTISGECKA